MGRRCLGSERKELVSCIVQGIKECTKRRKAKCLGCIGDVITILLSDGDCYDNEFAGLAT
jgi:hypothetical protein